MLGRNCKPARQKKLANHHGDVVLVGDCICGYSDRRGWVCQNLKSGENVWEEKGNDRPGKRSVTCLDGRLLCCEENTGSLTCVKRVKPGIWKRLEV